ncbi:hypothetical protein ABTN75_19920, partial [Acinetobacter baumannii]
LARHFAWFINTTFVGVWAAANGNVLTITAHSPAPAYTYPLTAAVEHANGSNGSAVASGAISGGNPGTWEVDPAQSPALNRAARDWHAGFY